MTARIYARYIMWAELSGPTPIDAHRVLEITQMMAQSQAKLFDFFSSHKSAESDGKNFYL